MAVLYWASMSLTSPVGTTSARSGRLVTPNTGLICNTRLTVNVCCFFCSIDNNYLIETSQEFVLLVLLNFCPFNIEIWMFCMKNPSLYFPEKFVLVVFFMLLVKYHFCFQKLPSHNPMTTKVTSCLRVVSRTRPHLNILSNSTFLLVSIEENTL